MKVRSTAYNIKYFPILSINISVAFKMELTDSMTFWFALALYKATLVEPLNPNVSIEI
ncbi:MAG: hypothetical protein Q4Q06_00150 [Bacteroidota bacterium]|nr:hypothetical protein [Bacteroidota bacterium]